MLYIDKAAAVSQSELTNGLCVCLYGVCECVQKAVREARPIIKTANYNQLQPTTTATTREAKTAATITLPYISSNNESKIIINNKHQKYGNEVHAVGDGSERVRVCVCVGVKKNYSHSLAVD